MKKIRLTAVVLSVAMLISVLAGCSRTYTYDESKIVRELFNEKDYRYKELNNEADLIARVKITDELTNENSRIVFYVSGHADSFTSDRQAEIVKVYKNADGNEISGSITVTENVGIGDDGKCYMSTKEKGPFEKDKEYLVFLKKGTGGKYILMSQSKGKYDFNAKNNGNEITFKFLLDYELAEDNENVPIILNLPEALGVIDFINYLPNETIKTNFGDIIVQQAVTNENNYHFELWKDGTLGGNIMLSNIR